MRLKDINGVYLENENSTSKPFSPRFKDDSSKVN